MAWLLWVQAFLRKASDLLVDADKAFCVQDIDAILAGRTQKRQLGSRAGNMFSTATFAAEEQPVSVARSSQSALGLAAA